MVKHTRKESQMDRDKGNKPPLTSMSSSSPWPHQTRFMADSQYQHHRQQHAATAGACLIHLQLQLKVQLPQPPYQQQHRQPRRLHRRRLRWLRLFHNITIIPTSRLLLSFLPVRPLLLHLHRLLPRLLPPLLLLLLNNTIPTTVNYSNNPLE